MKYEIIFQIEILSASILSNLLLGLFAGLDIEFGQKFDHENYFTH